MPPECNLNIQSCSSPGKNIAGPLWGALPKGLEDWGQSLIQSSKKPVEEMETSFANLDKSQAAQGEFPCQFFVLPLCKTWRLLPFLPCLFSDNSNQISSWPFFFFYKINAIQKSWLFIP